MIFYALLLLVHLIAIFTTDFRLERCNLCFMELEKVKRCLPFLTRFIFPLNGQIAATLIPAANCMCIELFTFLLPEEADQFQNLLRS